MKLHPHQPVKPWDVFYEEMESRGLKDPDWLREALWLNGYEFRQLIRGDWRIDFFLSQRMSRLTGTSKKFWCELDLLYLEDLEVRRHRRLAAANAAREAVRKWPKWKLVGLNLTGKGESHG